MSCTPIESPIHHSHDLGYKYLFSSKYLFLELLQSVLSAGWIAELDVDSLYDATKSFVTEDFKSKHADLIYQVQLEDQDLYLCLLTELQSTVDFTMPYRLLSYMMEAWAKILLNTPANATSTKGFRLPPVVPVVIYNGKNNWTAVREFKEMLAGHELFGKEIVNFAYYLIDVNRYSRDELKNMSNTIGAIFLLDQKYDIIELPERLLDVIDMLKGKTSRPSFQPFKGWFENNIVPLLSEDLVEDFYNELEGLSSKGVDELRSNIAENFEEFERRAIQKGIQKGYDKGLEQGERNNRIEVAKNMLRRNLPIDAVADITELSVQEVTQLGKELN